MDIWTEGSGSGNCWEDNSADATFDPGRQPEVLLYPKCGGNPQTKLGQRPASRSPSA